MKYKVGDVVKYSNAKYTRHDLIVDVNGNEYTVFCVEGEDCEPFVDDVLHTDFEKDIDVIITDPAIINEMNKQYKICNIKQILSK